MRFKKGDRVVFIGEPLTEVTEWLLKEQIPGTVHETSGSLVFVAWDGLDDKIRSTWKGTRFDHGRGHRNGWGVHNHQLALLDSEMETVGDPSDLLASLLQIM